MSVQVLKTGSSGNAVLYFNSILIDAGVPFSVIAPYASKIQIVLLTHEHGDHLNVSTLKKLQEQRPGIRIASPYWLLDKIRGLRNIDVVEFNQFYSYVDFQIANFKLYHDVPNCGWRIFRHGMKVFHATDTAHLQGIFAREYDIYAIEHNYDEETIAESIEKKKALGRFAYEEGSINSHLSAQAAQDFFLKNKHENSVLVRLHESKNN